jgi:hypothetical protein
MADVAFHQIGHPKFSIDQSKVSRRSVVATIEDELRQAVVTAVVTRQDGGSPQRGASQAGPRQQATEKVQ